MIIIRLCLCKCIFLLFQKKKFKKNIFYFTYFEQYILFAYYIFFIYYPLIIHQIRNQIIKLLHDYLLIVSP